MNRQVDSIEWYLLAGLVLGEQKSIKQILRHIKMEYFSDPIKGKIFAIVKELHLTHGTVDSNMLIAELKSAGVPTKEVLSGIFPGGEAFYPNSETGYYISAVLDEYKKRCLSKCIVEAKEMLDEKIGASAEAIIKKISKELVHIQAEHDDLKVVTSTAELVKDIKNQKNRLLIPTGFREFDKAFFGLRLGQYVVIAGRPSSGKTAFCLSLISNMLSKGGMGCAYVSLETDANTIMYRMLSSQAQVDLSNILKGDITDAEEKRLTSSAKSLSEQDFFVLDTFKMSTNDIRDSIRQMKHYAPTLSLVVVDHIGLLAGDKKKARHEELGSISRELKMLARELNVIIIPIVQFNRSIETENRVLPKLADLRECGGIEQDADVVLAFHNDSERSHRTIRILKAKEGEANVSVKLGWDGARQTFS